MLMNDAYPGADRMAVPAGATGKSGTGNKTIEGQLNVKPGERTSFVEFKLAETPTGTPGAGPFTKKTADHPQRLVIKQGSVKNEFDPHTLPSVAVLSSILAAEAAEFADDAQTLVDELVDASATNHTGRFVLPVALKPGVASWQLDTYPASTAFSEWTTITALETEAALIGYMERVEGVKQYHALRAIYKAGSSSFKSGSDEKVIKAYLIAAHGVLSGTTVTVDGMSDFEIAENIAYFDRKQGGSGLDIVQIEPKNFGAIDVNMSTSIDFVIVLFKQLG